MRANKPVWRPCAIKISDLAYYSEPKQEGTEGVLAL